ncbi:MAG: hypothetical protein ACE5HD_12490 [Acidobacteriota bacterium]
MAADLKEAIKATRQGRYLQALDLFETDPEMAVHGLSPERRSRLLSYYGLCLAMVSGETARPLTWCEAAIKHAPSHPDLYYNYGMVCLRARRRGQALSLFLQGLRLDPGHRLLLVTLNRLRDRRRPLFSFLPRKHPLNRLSGMALHRIQTFWRPQNPLFPGM